MVFTASPTFHLVSPPEYASQPHPNPSINIGECCAFAVLEIPKPAFEGFIYLLYDTGHTISVGSFGLGADCVSEFPHALVAWPSRVSYEMIAEKVKTFSIHVHECCLFRM